MRISDWSSDVCSSDLRCARSSGENLLMPFKALFFCLPMLFASTVMAQEAAEKPAPMRSPAASVPVEPENVLDLDLSDGGRLRIPLRPDLSPNPVERIHPLWRRGFYDEVLFTGLTARFLAT